MIYYNIFFNQERYKLSQIILVIVSVQFGFSEIWVIKKIKTYLITIISSNNISFRLLLYYSKNYLISEKTTPCHINLNRANFFEYFINQWRTFYLLSANFVM